MAIEIGRYQFHSWSRKGIAANIAAADDFGAASAPELERALVPIGVALNGAGMSKNFALVGPGDIVGINSECPGEGPLAEQYGVVRMNHSLRA